MLFAFGAIILAWYLAWPASGYARQIIADTLFILLPLLTAALSWRTGRRSGAAGLQWRFVSLGCLAWAAGSMIWAGYEVVWRTQAPFPSLADAAYLLFYPLCSIGLVVGIRKRRIEGLSSAAMVLDSVLVFLAATVICYRFLLLPLLEGPTLSNAAVATSLLWEVGTFALLFLNIGALLWTSGLRHQRSLVLLLLGFMSFAVTNVLYGQMAIAGTYASGHMLDLGWHAGFLLIGAAAAIAPLGSAQVVGQTDSIVHETTVASRSAALVVGVLIISGLVIITAAQPDADPVLSIGRGLFAIVVALRLRYAATQSTRLHERTRERDRLQIEAAAAAELAETNQALHAAELQFRALVEQQPSVVYTAERDAIRTPRYVSPQQVKLTGHSPADLLERPDVWINSIELIDRPRVLAEVERTNLTGEPFFTEYRVRRGDEIVWIRDEAALIRDEDGAPLFWQGLRLDVTEQKWTEETLEQERDLLHALMDSVPDLVYFKDLESRFTRLNAPTAYNIGLARPELAIGKTDAELFPDVGRDWVEEEQRVLREGEPIVDRLVEHTLIGGERRWLLNNKVPIRDRSGAIVGLVGIGRDVTARLALEAKLEHQAFHEPLTGLPNRRHFAQQLEAALSAELMPAVIFLDLDGFKAVNDSLGHGAGDEVLKQVGARLRSGLRQGDLLARFGGDEFAILLTDLTDATVIAERLLSAIQNPFMVAGREVYIGASAGIAAARDRDLTVDMILRAADTALYKAKRCGRGRWVLFDEELGARAHERLHLEAGLRAALQNNELELYFQPIIELANNRIHSLEAQIRWRHPERGLLDPEEFIPLAEETGLILPLGEWALLGACRQAAAWQSLRPHDPPTVVVGVSAQQLRGPAYRQALWRTLSETGMSPERLTLKVSEAAVADDEAVAAEFLSAVKGFGVCTALDDFGMGYVSLGRLPALPLDMLKIGQLVTETHDRSSHAVAIVRAMTMLGHELGMTVTAGGIETAEHLLIAQECGCDYGQGSCIARPMTIAESTEVLLQDAAGIARLRMARV
jgi:diguanylate cyclase (GGDEF)-like protein/PAS domain S-box-containing protein